MLSFFDKCNKLLKPAIHVYGETYSRPIDKVIHDESIEKLHFLEKSHGETEEHLAKRKYKLFIQHQLTILNAVKGCEKQVFNDPLAHYDNSKPHLSGPTGTMSSILTNGYLFLYYTLLRTNKDLQVNADADLRILLNLIGCSYKGNGELTMPPEELALLRAIVAELLPRRTPAVDAIFTPNWYEGYGNAMLDLDAYLTEKIIVNGKEQPRYRYYISRNGTKLPIGRAIVSYLDAEVVKQASAKGYLPQEMGDLFRLWETRPPYADLTNAFGKYTTDQTIDEIIPFLTTIFPPTEVQTMPAPRAVANPATYGGKSRRRKQRKLKRKHKTRRRS